MTENSPAGVPSPPHDDAPVIEEGMIPDIITQKPLKDTDKEKVRQEVARQFIFEYQIAPESMQTDFPVKVEGKRKKIDIAIFEAGKEHTAENLRRAVICRPFPNVGKKSVVKIRDFAQAEKDLDELKGVMTAGDNCEWGLWTNGLERFFLKKKKRRFEPSFDPHGDWPMADGTMTTPDMHAETYVRPGEDNGLRRAFQRCHNFIHGNEGMPKDAAFWQFLYLIFAKMHDERTNRGAQRQFFAYADEPFSDEGRMKIRVRIKGLFDSVKRQYSSTGIFRPGDEITLSDRALAYMVMELARYNFSRSDVDAKGAAYQEIVGANLRGDRGQYFTPRGAVDLVVKILNPRPDEKVLDIACGTGGFLVATLAHQLRRFRAEYNREVGDKTQDTILDRLRDYAQNKVFGADFDPFLVRASMMNVLMAANTEGHIFHMDSLAFPRSHLPGNDLAKQLIPFGSVDVLMTNPPFGSEIPVTERAILENNPLARRPPRFEHGHWVEQTGTQNAVAPEILFISQSLAWLRPGGRMGIVLPNGILGNPGDEHIRRWILRHCWVLACVEVPVEAFIVEANVGILTSLLFLKKKTETEMDAEAQGHVREYPIFMAVAEKCGFDRRGNVLHKRNPDGTERLVTRMLTEKVKLNGETITRQRKVVEPEIDDDFPAIFVAYEEFRKKHAEPGARSRASRPITIAASRSSISRWIISTSSSVRMVPARRRSSTSQSSLAKCWIAGASRRHFLRTPPRTRGRGRIRLRTWYSTVLENFSSSRSRPNSRSTSSMSCWRSAWPGHRQRRWHGCEKLRSPGSPRCAMRSSSKSSMVPCRSLRSTCCCSQRVFKVPTGKFAARISAVCWVSG